MTNASRAQGRKFSISVKLGDVCEKETRKYLAMAPPSAVPACLDDQPKVADRSSQSSSTMLSSTITNVSSRSTSRSRKEPVRFDPGADVAAEVKATAAAATTAAAAAGNPTATTITSSKAAAVVSSKKNKKRVATATKEKRKNTAATTATKTVAKKKSAPWTAAEDRRLGKIISQGGICPSLSDGRYLVPIGLNRKERLVAIAKSRAVQLVVRVNNPGGDDDGDIIYTYFTSAQARNDSKELTTWYNANASKKPPALPFLTAGPLAIQAYIYQEGKFKGNILCRTKDGLTEFNRKRAYGNVNLRLGENNVIKRAERSSTSTTNALQKRASNAQPPSKPVHG